MLQSTSSVSYADGSPRIDVMVDVNPARGPGCLEIAHVPTGAVRSQRATPDVGGDRALVQGGCIGGMASTETGCSVHEPTSTIFFHLMPERGVLS